MHVLLINSDLILIENYQTNTIYISEANGLLVLVIPDNYYDICGIMKKIIYHPLKM